MDGVVDGCLVGHDLDGNLVGDTAGRVNRDRGAPAGLGGCSLFLVILVLVFISDQIKDDIEVRDDRAVDKAVAENRSGRGIVVTDLDEV